MVKPFEAPAAVADMLTFTIDRNEYSRTASDPLYQITLDEVTDADPGKTPWILGTRWEVDSYADGTVGYIYNTYHQIWVRANV